MNNEEKKFEENKPNKVEKASNGIGRVNGSTDEEVDYITKRLPLKSWGKSYMERCIIIYNIDYTTTKEELLEQFKQVDGFEKMFLLKDPHHPELCNRGIAYVTYSKAKEAELALKKLNHELIGNRRIRIEKATDPDIKPKSKLSKKDFANSIPPDQPLLDSEDPLLIEPDFLPHSRSERHRRSRHSVHPDIDHYDGVHHHSYRRHRSSTHSSHIGFPNFDYLGHSILSPQLQMIASAPLFRDYQAIPPIYLDSRPLMPKMEVNSQVEDLVNELSILFELYRDALLTQNINDMNEQKKTK